MNLIWEASKDTALIEMAVQSFASLYTEEDFNKGKDGALKVTKGTFINTLDIEKFSTKQKDTINGIIVSLAAFFNTQIIVKSRRLSMSIPTRRAFSADLDMAEDPQAQKTKNYHDSPFSKI